MKEGEEVVIGRGYLLVEGGPCSRSCCHISTNAFVENWGQEEAIWSLLGQSMETILKKKIENIQNYLN